MNAPRIRIIYPSGFIQPDIEYMAVRGVITGVKIELPDGTTQRLAFMDLTRIQHEATLAFQRGDPCFTEEGLVIVPEVTHALIERTVQELWNTGFWSGRWRVDED